MTTRLRRVTATGLVQAAPCWVKAITLAAGGAPATLAIQDTSAGGGTDVFSLAAPANVAQAWVSGDSEGVWFSAGVYAALTGAGASASFELEV